MLNTNINYNEMLISEANLLLELNKNKNLDNANLVDVQNLLNKIENKNTVFEVSLLIWIHSIPNLMSSECSYNELKNTGINIFTTFLKAKDPTNCSIENIRTLVAMLLSFYTFSEKETFQYIKEIKEILKFSFLDNEVYLFFQYSLEYKLLDLYLHLQDISDQDFYILLENIKKHKNDYERLSILYKF